jgi:hypothetical protein
MRSVVTCRLIVGLMSIAAVSAAVAAPAAANTEPSHATTNASHAAAPAAAYAGVPAAAANATRRDRVSDRPSSMPAALCGWQPTNNHNLGGHFVASGVRIRTGPSTTCTVKGLGYPSDAVVYRCWAWGDSFTWTYLTDLSNGVTGWVRDDLLSGPLTDLEC